MERGGPQSRIRNGELHPRCMEEEELEMRLQEYTKDRMSFKTRQGIRALSKIRKRQLRCCKQQVILRRVLKETVGYSSLLGHLLSML